MPPCSYPRFTALASEANVAIESNRIGWQRPVRVDVVFIVCTCIPLYKDVKSSLCELSEHGRGPYIFYLNIQILPPQYSSCQI